MPDLLRNGAAARPAKWMAMPGPSKEAHCPAHMMQLLLGLDALDQLFLGLDALDQPLPGLDTWAQKDVLLGPRTKAGAQPSASSACWFAPWTKTKQVPDISVLGSPWSSLNWSPPGPKVVMDQLLGLRQLGPIARLGEGIVRCPVAGERFGEGGLTD
ncbi:hypothetical protein Droror1_Dr00022624 [Drosera rotundifolia]